MTYHPREKLQVFRGKFFSKNIVENFGNMKNELTFAVC